MVQNLNNWCSAQLAQAVSLRALPGDAGQRRYYRLEPGSHRMLAVEAPPESERNNEWLAVHRMLEKAGVRVPRIYHYDLGRGFWLIEDLGDRLLYTVLRSCTDEAVDGWYHKSISVLLDIQGGRALEDAHCLQDFSRDAFIEELSLFNDWFVRRLLGITPGVDALHSWELLCGIIGTECDLCLPVPQHGDYQSRNLILTAEQELAVIDFQDASWGSPAYDLVSLLKDCYLCWTRERVRAWTSSYRRRAVAAGLIDPSIGETEFMRHFDLVGLQRHLRVLGTFARLHLRDAKSDYLQHVPRIMAYVDEAMGCYPDLGVFAQYWNTVRLSAEDRSWGSIS